MKMLAYILATLSTVGGAILSLFMVVFVMAASANTQPADWPATRNWIVGIAAGGILCFLAGIALTIMQKPIWGGIIGALPFVFFVGVLIWLVLSG
jgi:hypothetical protein